MEFTDEQRDFLTEVINVGVGRAAGILNELLDIEIKLEVPYLELRTEGSIPNSLQLEENLSIVEQRFSGETNGKASLIFPSKSAIKLVSLLTGEDEESDMLDSVRSGTLLEVGNIVINGLIGSISNILNADLTFELPEFMEVDIQQTMPSVEKGKIIILANTVFELMDTEIDSGFMIITLEFSNIEKLLNSDLNSIDMIF